MLKKYISMLQMARKSNNLLMGHDMVDKSIKEKKSQLIVFASDVSPRLKKELGYQLKKSCLDIEMIEIPETIDEIHHLIGYKAGVMSVNDLNFSNRIKELINQEV